MEDWWIGFVCACHADLQFAPQDVSACKFWTEIRIWEISPKTSAKPYTKCVIDAYKWLIHILVSRVTFVIAKWITRFSIYILFSALHRFITLIIEIQAPHFHVNLWEDTHSINTYSYEVTFCDGRYQFNLLSALTDTSFLTMGQFQKEEDHCNNWSELQRDEETWRDHDQQGDKDVGRAI